MLVVDTNILVYAMDGDSPFHSASTAAIEKWRLGASAWYLTWGIVYEFLRVTTHPKILRQPLRIDQAWQFISALLASPSLGILVPTDRHARVASEVIAEMPHLGGNILHDATTAILMREHGIKSVFTRDTDFHRFKFLETIDPTG